MPVIGSTFADVLEEFTRLLKVERPCFKEADFARSNYWLNALLLDEGMAEERDTLLKFLNDRGINSRPVWTLMHKLPMFSDCPRMDLTKAESLERRLANIPSSPCLGERDVQT